MIQDTMKRRCGTSEEQKLGIEPELVFMIELDAGLGHIAENVGDKLRRYVRADVASELVSDVSVWYSSCQ